MEWFDYLRETQKETDYRYEIRINKQTFIYLFIIDTERPTRHLWTDQMWQGLGFVVGERWSGDKF